MGMNEWEISLVLGVILLYFSIQDLRYLSLSPMQWAVAVGVACFCQTLAGSEENRLIMGMLPGGLWMLFGHVSHRVPGMGDGAVLVLIGLLMGPWICISIAFFALLLAAGYSILGLLLGKLKRQSEYPFVPFLFVAYLGVRFL